MQTLPESAESADKPRYRAACDACRQSKVRCSGNGVCVRCKKHDYKCRYSIAHRAGKPKGSKNKATLKKLESLRAGQGSTSSKGKPIATTKALNPSRDPGFPLQRKWRKTLSTHHNIRKQCDPEFPLQSQSRHASYAIAHKYAFPGPEIMYPSGLHPGMEPHSWGRTTTTGAGVYDHHLQTLYGHIPSSAMVQYTPSLRDESLASLREQPDLPIIAGVCDCLERLGTCQRQLYNLDPDVNLWRPDSTMDLITGSLSSCHVFLNCAICSRNTSNIWFLVSLLDRTFDVLNQFFFHRTNRHDSGIWFGQQQQQQYHDIPYNHAAALQDSILEQAIATTYQVVHLLQEIVDSEMAKNEAGSLGDVNELSSALSSASPSSASIACSPASSTTFKESPPGDNGDFNQRQLQPSSNGPPAVDVNFLLQVIHRYETVVRNMQALITHSNTAAIHANSHTSWPITGSDNTANQCGSEQYQSTAIDGFLLQQQQQPQIAGFGIYDTIGLS